MVSSELKLLLSRRSRCEVCALAVCGRLWWTETSTRTWSQAWLRPPSTRCCWPPSTTTKWRATRSSSWKPQVGLWEHSHLLNYATGKTVLTIFIKSFILESIVFIFLSCILSYALGLNSFSVFYDVISLILFSSFQPKEQPPLLRPPPPQQVIIFFCHYMSTEVSILVLISLRATKKLFFFSKQHWNIRL